MESSIYNENPVGTAISDACAGASGVALRVPPHQWPAQDRARARARVARIVHGLRRRYPKPHREILLKLTAYMLFPCWETWKPLVPFVRTMPTDVVRVYAETAIDGWLRGETPRSVESLTATVAVCAAGIIKHRRPRPRHRIVQLVTPREHRAADAASAHHACALPRSFGARSPGGDDVGGEADGGDDLVSRRQSGASHRVKFVEGLLAHLQAGRLTLEHRATDAARRLKKRKLEAHIDLNHFDPALSLELDRVAASRVEILR
jgi:hypothetical protein